MFGIKQKRRIEELEKENRFLKVENDAIKKASDKVTAAYHADMRMFQSQIETLNGQIKKLTRKRDEKGRFVSKKAQNIN